MLEPWYKIGLADVACVAREFLYMIVELLIKNVNICVMLNWIMKWSVTYNLILWSITTLRIKLKFYAFGEVRLFLFYDVPLWSQVIVFTCFLYIKALCL
jgi:hypothetical protein